MKLCVSRRLPATLSVEEVTVILGACDRLRDRFLFAWLAETCMRFGQALGLRHEDLVIRQRRVRSCLTATTPTALEPGPRGTDLASLDPDHANAVAAIINS